MGVARFRSGSDADVARISATLAGQSHRWSSLGFQLGEADALQFEKFPISFAIQGPVGIGIAGADVAHS